MSEPRESLEQLMSATHTHEHMQRQDDAVQTYDEHTPLIGRVGRYRSWAAVRKNR